MQSSLHPMRKEKSDDPCRSPTARRSNASSYSLNDLLSSLLFGRATAQGPSSSFQSEQQTTELEELFIDNISLSLPSIDQWDASFDIPEDFNQNVMT